MMARSAKRQHQLEAMWAACRTPEADQKRRETMQRRWRDDPTMQRTLVGLRSPEVAKRSGLARRRPLEERFFAKVEKDGSGCWLWTGAQNTQGYGFINDLGQKRRATHVVFSVCRQAAPRCSPLRLALLRQSAVRQSWPPALGDGKGKHTRREGARSTEYLGPKRTAEMSGVFRQEDSALRFLRDCGAPFIGRLT